VSGARICRASVAICSSRVEMDVEHGVSSIVPSRSSVFRRALCSTGSLGSVPPLHRSIGALRLLAAYPASLRCLRSAVPPQFNSRRRRGLPSSSAILATRAPALRPRWNRQEQDLRDLASLRFAPSMLPSAPSVASASTTWIFRGPIPQPVCSLSTLRDPGCPRSPRKTRFRLAVLPCRAGVRPAGLHYKVSVMSGLHGILLVEASWRTEGPPKPGETRRKLTEEIL
jgi:hypothetical protein